MKHIAAICLMLACLACTGQTVRWDTSEKAPPPKVMSYDSPQIQYINEYFDKKFGNVDLERVDPIETGLSTQYWDVWPDGTDTILQTRVDLPLWSTEDLDGAAPILYGDLNHDHKRDMVVSVTVRGNGKGDSTVTQYLFTFLQINHQLKIASVTTDDKLSGCPPHKGHFRATRISNGILYGKAACAPLDDGRCCQEPYYDAEVQLVGKKLVFKRRNLHKK